MMLLKLDCIAFELQNNKKLKQTEDYNGTFINVACPSRQSTEN
jgi:hypothetical protein